MCIYKKINADLLSPFLCDYVLAPGCKLDESGDPACLLKRPCLWRKEDWLWGWPIFLRFRFYHDLSYLESAWMLLLSSVIFWLSSFRYSGALSDHYDQMRRATNPSSLIYWIASQYAIQWAETISPPRDESSSCVSTDQLYEEYVGIHLS